MRVVVVGPVHTYEVKEADEHGDMPPGFDVYVESLEQPVGWAPTLNEAIDVVDDLERKQ